jgi:Na+:H+ antiporter, NhaA family
MIREFLRLESAAGILLLIAAVLAMVLANSPLAYLYDALLDTAVAVEVGQFSIDKPLLLWINDGLMAVFFFLIGLEIKREVLEGELSTPAQIVLPGLGALGGMLVPAAIYAWFNRGDPTGLNGWAIPVATDIAFALALLSVFGSRVPPALKVFLMTLAIFDDLAAIVIIAIFYTSNLSTQALLFAAVALAAGVAMNRLGVERSSSYIALGIVLWVAVLKSGVHATLAGVLVAFCVPMRDSSGGSPLKSLEHDLHGTVAFVILPVFAFANAGLALGGMTGADLADPITLGVILGLLAGKPIGIMFFTGVAIIAGLARFPERVGWAQLLGVSFTCGIGFTMSLFIAGLAFENTGVDHFSGDRLGILVGSILAAVAAYVILNACLPRKGSMVPD